MADQPSSELRQLRRLVACREDMVNRYLAHETWADRTGLWSPKGQQRLAAFVQRLPHTDAQVIGQKQEELG